MHLRQQIIRRWGGSRRLDGQSAHHTDWQPEFEFDSLKHTNFKKLTVTGMYHLPSYRHVQFTQLQVCTIYPVTGMHRHTQLQACTITPSYRHAPLYPVYIVLGTEPIDGLMHARQALYPALSELPVVSGYPSSWHISGIPKTLTSRTNTRLLNLSLQRSDRREQ